VSIPSVSFWRQDVSWYIQQQSWTQSFYQSDRNWTAQLSGNATSTATAQTNQSAGSASIADAKIVTLVNAQSDSTLTGALQASQARSGTLINLLT
jgi:hypothetical protein